MNDDKQYPELLAQLRANCDEIIGRDGLNHGGKHVDRIGNVGASEGPSGLTVGREEVAIALEPEIATDWILRKGTMTSTQRLSDAPLTAALDGATMPRFQDGIGYEAILEKYRAELPFNIYSKLIKTSARGKLSSLRLFVSNG